MSARSAPLEASTALLPSTSRTLHSRVRSPRPGNPPGEACVWCPANESNVA